MERFALLINFNGFLPKEYVDLGGLVILLIVILGVAFSLYRWRGTLSSRISGYSLPSYSKARVLAENLTIDVLYQKSIADCSKMRWFAHLAMFWGFIGLAITTTLDAIMNPAAGPLGLFSPIRILGNLSGVFFVVGVSISLARRVAVADVRKNSTVGDTVFLSLLILTGVTGFITEIFSQFNFVTADSFSYWLHLILVAALLASAPFTKFVHAIGRPILLLVKRAEIEKSNLADEQLSRETDNLE